MTKRSAKVLAYDIGGTKIAAAVVHSSGKVLAEVREPIAVRKGKKAVFEQLIQIGKTFQNAHQDIRAIGVASAGPLDPRSGDLLDPHNFATLEHGRWGIVPLGRVLKKGLGLPVTLENDAAAAILAERWKGEAKGFDNALILTLGTGLGVGVICNGDLVRAGRHLHPEGGHILLDGDAAFDPPLCGCGVRGCAEAYLSGKNFGKWAARFVSNPSLSSQNIADRARRGDPKALKAFEIYARQLARALNVFIRLYYPEIVVLTGSFSQASDLFLSTAEKNLKGMLSWNHVKPDLTPKIRISSLDNQAGVLGGAFVALENLK